MSNDLFCLASTEGFFLKINPAFEKNLGYSEEELTSRKFLDFIHPDDVESTLSEVAKLAEGQKTIGFENRYRKKDGDYIWLQWNSTPDPNSGLLYAVARNITEQKRLTNLLQETQTIGKIGAWEMNPESGETFWTDQIYHIYGIPEGNPTNVQVGLSQYHPDDREAISKAVEESISKKLPYDLKLRFLQQSGKEIWVRAKGNPILNKEGMVTLVRGTFQDIDEEERLSLAHKANREIQKILIDHSPAAIAMLDKEMRYLAHSKSWLRDYELGEVEIIGKSHLDIFPDLPETWKAEYEKVLKGKVVKKDRDHWKRKDESDIFLAWEFRPWYSSQNEIGGIILFTQVITDLITTERGLQETVTELEKSNIDLEQFAYIASHDMREPLRMIGNFSELLEIKFSKDLPNQGKDYLNRIVKSAERLQNLVDSLLEYSRVGRKEAKMEEISFKKLVNSNLEQLALIIEEKNAKIDIQDGDLHFKAVEDQLGMVFYNLINNGLKFNTSSPPHIIIGFKEEGQYLKFTVQDNGIGIPQAQTDKIFMAFQRLNNSEDYSGSGIGLALCKKIVERHGGNIHCLPQKEGCIFEFSIDKQIRI